MSKGASTLILVLVAAAAGFGGGLLARQTDERKAPVRAEPRSRAEIARLQEQLADHEQRLTAQERRVSPEIEVAPPLTVEEEPGATPSREDPAGEDPSGADPTGGEPGKRPATVGDLLDGILGETFSSTESDALFMRLGENRERIAEVVAEIRKRIERDPKNPDLRCALAVSLTAKAYMAMEPGPAQWQTYGEATQSYEKAIELEPEHWQARFGLAFGNSMAPEFAGLRPKAIRGFEELMKLQETRAPAEEHAQVYLRLGTLYKDAGNPEKARAIWKRGLKRHPESEQLREVVSILEER